MPDAYKVDTDIVIFSLGGENGTYGGHVFAQAAWAAAQTVDEGYMIHVSSFVDFHVYCH
jgi:acyl-CoA thioesterase